MPKNTIRFRFIYLSTKYREHVFIVKVTFLNMSNLNYLGTEDPNCGLN